MSVHNEATAQLLTVSEVSARLKISQRQCWKLLAAGKLPRPVLLARSVRWLAADLDRFVVACGCDMNRFESEAVTP